MTTLFHFLFELIKIFILSCVYSVLVVILFRFIGRLKPNSWFDRVSRIKLILWLFSLLTIAVALFIYMNTYWGSHGLGDSARIPLGNKNSINGIDFSTAYIEGIDRETRTLIIDRFIVTDSFIYGLTGDMNENYEGDYFIYDLKKRIAKTFTKQNDFEAALKFYKLDTQPDYKDFDYYYKKHWHGWRFWLLP
ncbi:MAG: hypothetical protein ABL872_15360 [Lacibacter sp.]